MKFNKNRKVFKTFRSGGFFMQKKTTNTDVGGKKIASK